MGLGGSVKAFSLDDLLNFLVASGHRGTLHVFHQDARKTLYLDQGGLYFERSNWSFRLGDAMVRCGMLTHQQVAEALGLQQLGGRDRLGDLLIKLGHTTEEKILEARRYQVEEEIYELFSWEDAFFEFHKDELPEDFGQRLGDPEEFRFEVQSVLMEAARRLDEWGRIRELLPSEKRLYVLGDAPEAAEKVAASLEGTLAAGREPEDVFSGTTTLIEYPHLLGLTTFEAKALVANHIEAGYLRALRRHELEARFRLALDQELPYALKLYECALESPEFEQRGRFIDRVIFGHAEFKAAAEKDKLSFSARVKGKRAFEMLLALFRLGIPCEFSATEEGRTLQLGISNNSLVWRVSDDDEPPNIVRHLLSRSPVNETDMSRVRELQRETKRSLKHILVGGGYVTMDNWFRAQKDAVLNEMFNILLLKRPFVEVRTGEYRAEGNPGLDVDVPLLPWLHAEVMKDIRQWEAILTEIPSPRAYLLLTEKGKRSIQSQEAFASFDGQRTLADVIALQPKSPQEFLTEVYKRLQDGRLAPLDADGYRERLEAVLAAGKRADAIDICLAATDANVDKEYFRSRLRSLEAVETEISTQTVRPTLRGDLDHFSLAEVLQSFHLSKRTGSLRVRTKGDHARSRELYFESGEVYLLAGDDTGEDLGDTSLLEEELVAKGLLDEDQLASEAAQQMKDEVYEIFLWEGAEFEFAADHLPPEFYSSSHHRKIRLKTVEFLMEAVRRSAEWEEVRKVIPADDRVLTFESNQAKVRAVTEKGAADLLLLVDGRHPVADLVRISGMRRFQALSVLAELVREGALTEVDVTAAQEADEEAIVSADLPTSGVIEEGFVGQLQFVGTIQDMASASLTGVLRVTDGRRSKEMALIEGVPYRTGPYRPARSDAEHTLEASSLDAARDVSECFSWSGVRFELLVDTLPPKLEKPDEREALRLDPDIFFDAFAEAGERWGLVAELVPRDLAIAYKTDEAIEKARELAGDGPELAWLVDGQNTAEDIARRSQAHFQAMSWLVDLFEHELVEAVETAEEDAEEDWDFSL